VREGSYRKAVREKSYRQYRWQHLRYNEFKKIDFVDQDGREYVFNIPQKDNTMPSIYDKPPTYITDKTFMEDTKQIPTASYGKISFSVRLPTRKHDASKDLAFPIPNDRKIYLKSPETGVLCVGKVHQMFSQPRSKTGEIVLKDFTAIGLQEDDS
jgi:hypothetical protein